MLWKAQAVPRCRSCPTAFWPLGPLKQLPESSPAPHVKEEHLVVPALELCWPRSHGLQAKSDSTPGTGKSKGLFCVPLNQPSELTCLTSTPCENCIVVGGGGAVASLSSTPRHTREMGPWQCSLWGWAAPGMRGALSRERGGLGRVLACVSLATQHGG